MIHYKFWTQNSITANLLEKPSQSPRIE